VLLTLGIAILEKRTGNGVGFTFVTCYTNLNSHDNFPYNVVCYAWFNLGRYETTIGIYFVFIDVLLSYKNIQDHKDNFIIISVAIGATHQDR
jgi:hypothetical protein